MNLAPWWQEESKPHRSWCQWDLVLQTQTWSCRLRPGPSLSGFCVKCWLSDWSSVSFLHRFGAVFRFWVSDWTHPVLIQQQLKLFLTDLSSVCRLVSDQFLFRSSSGLSWLVGSSSDGRGCFCFLSVVKLRCEEWSLVCVWRDEALTQDVSSCDQLTLRSHDLSEAASVTSSVWWRWFNWNVHLTNLRDLVWVQIQSQITVST